MSIRGSTFTWILAPCVENGRGTLLIHLKTSTKHNPKWEFGVSVRGERAGGEGRARVGVFVVALGQAGGAVRWARAARARAVLWGVLEKWTL